MACCANEGPRRFRYQRKLRLRGQRAFQAVYAARVRKNAGPLSLYALPNGLEHARLGLSVSRRVGTAAQRNRIKRLLREAFRLTRHDWPSHYDVIIVVRPHEPATLQEYQHRLLAAVNHLHLQWQRRRKT